ncbi:MAG: SurA N-terminal domain-containing protein [Acidobacteria bacterium]|nr:SurA N-terminal domain-containing protein [Acidobacteriota bacterium]
MLKFLSKQRRARNAFIVLFSGIMVAGLVILYVPVGDSILGTAKTASDVEDTAAVASVDGDKISAGELRKALARISQSQYGRQFDDFSLLKSFSGDMLEQLITQRVVEVEARRLGIGATDDEVFQRLRPSFSDKSGNFVGFDRYRRAIESNGQTVEEFEDAIRYSIVDEKLRNYLSTGIEVSPREVEEEFNRSNTSLSLVFVKVDPKKYEGEVTASESEALEFFNQHRDEFKITDPERKADYLYIPIARLADTIEVPDKELQEEYERTKQDYTLGATVSDITLPFTDENQAEVRTKGDDLVARARGKADKPAEDFVKLGGKSLGYVKKDAQDTSYKQRVFTLRDPQKNVSDLITDEKNFHILKVADWRRKGFGEARSEVLKKVRERKARDQASQIADEMKKKLEETKNLRQVAEEFSKRLNLMPVDEIARQTGFFAATDTLPEFGTSSSSFTSTVSSIDQPGTVGSKVYLTDGYAVPVLSAKRDPKSAEFDEVKDRVIGRLKLDRATEAARKRAQEIIAKSPDAGALEKNAKAAGWEVQTQDDFKPGSSLTGLPRSEQLEGFALELQANQTSAHVVKVGDQLVLFAAKSRKDPDLTKLAAERDATRERLLNQRKTRLYQAYLDQAKTRLAENGKIVVYQTVLNAVFNTGAPEDTSADAPTGLKFGSGTAAQ